MDTFPKTGMKFEQARGRIKRYDSIKHGNITVRDSLINQVRLHEGEKASEELNKEFADVNNHSQPRVGGGSDLYRSNYDSINWKSKTTQSVSGFDSEVVNKNPAVLDKL